MEVGTHYVEPNLGAFRATFAGKNDLRWSYFYWSIVLLLGPFLLFGLLQIRPPNPKEAHSMMILFGGISAICVLLGAILLTGSILEKPCTFAIYDDGIVIHAEHTICVKRWHEISMTTQFLKENNAVMAALDIGDYFDYLEFPDAPRIEVGPKTVTNYDEFNGVIAFSLWRTKFPEMISRLNKGEEVHFGPLSLSSVGLRFNDRLVPYQSILVLNGPPVFSKIRVCLTDGQIIKSNCLIDDIPNFSVLQLSIEALKGEFNEQDLRY